jgi:hypothetical protein
MKDYEEGDIGPGLPDLFLLQHAKTGTSVPKYHKITKLP